MYYKYKYNYIKQVYGKNNYIMYAHLLKTLRFYKKHYHTLWQFPEGYDTYNAMFIDDKPVLSKQQSDIILDIMILFIQLQDNDTLLDYLYHDVIVLQPKQLNTLDNVKNQTYKQLNRLLKLFLKQIF